MPIICMSPSQSLLNGWVVPTSISILATCSPLWAPCVCVSCLCHINLFSTPSSVCFGCQLSTQRSYFWPCFTLHTLVLCLEEMILREMNMCCKQRYEKRTLDYYIANATITCKWGLCEPTQIKAAFAPALNVVFRSCLHPRMLFIKTSFTLTCCFKTAFTLAFCLSKPPSP